MSHHVRCPECWGAGKHDSGGVREDGMPIDLPCVRCAGSGRVDFSTITEEERQFYACRICDSPPDESGTIFHGKGCYQVSEDGGGESAAY